jgi:transcriptional regulator with XRE-family HTH domain
LEFGVRRISHSSKDAVWLANLGKHIEALIREKGYDSVYDFWIQKAGDDVSRATLNYIVAGKTDPKATTLRLIARLLGVKPSRIFDFG